MKESYPETIYLMPDGEGCVVWCDHTLPAEGMEKEDSVRYVRADSLAQQPESEPDDYTADNLAEDICDRLETILGRMAQLGGGLTRVVMGCELLIHNCCDKSLDHYDFSPEIKAALEREESQACQDVIAERQRQVNAEGWTPEHDDEHGCGELASAASCYATQGRYHYPTPGKPSPIWPWAPEWWKPSDYRRNLVKAGALILAEIERLDRASVNCHEPAEVQ